MIFYKLITKQLTLKISLVELTKLNQDLKRCLKLRIALLNLIIFLSQKIKLKNRLLQQQREPPGHEPREMIFKPRKTISVGLGLVALHPFPHNTNVFSSFFVYK